MKAKYVLIFVFAFVRGGDCLSRSVSRGRVGSSDRAG